ncbi:MAG: presqualene diphosphate synthase HpnD [Alphaproteobacteria bacterium]|nr:presqualene diphosphate synthase HpnD [Alphaproteobacteria bacterium]
MSALAQPASGERAGIKAQVAAAKTSFYWAMRFLPKPRREAMFAIYAFCRAVDDVADSDDAPAVKLASLAAWRRTIDAFYAGQPSDPLTRALAAAAAEYGLRRADFIGVIEGMEMDARADIRAPSLAELDLYCDRVACAVGRLSARIFGAPGDQADRVANALGRALQLTNILRDLAEDAARGRLYLPQELLDRHGIAAREPAAVLAHPKLSEVCEAVAAMAHARFAEARGAMAECPRGTMRPAAVMAAVYTDVLARLERRGWRRIDARVSAPAPLKLWYALRYGLL